MKLYRYHLDMTFPGIRLKTYDVIRTTPKGYWIKVAGSEKWVSSVSKKRYAYPTKELAWISFRMRCKRRTAILQSQLNSVRIALGFVCCNDPIDNYHLLYSIRNSTQY